ncbi:MAG: efflux RND transporter periplasmic adaptor subunit [Candidatus Eremiobacteraeota bacterium]|nr:efflux RND transporter periplasmic adaptor subunit [Candidatus Eremiobacteraeota bacterium]
MKSLLLFFLTVLLLTGVPGCKKHTDDSDSKKTAGPTSTPAVVPKVDYADVVRRSIPTEAKLTGSITANDPIEVSPQISGSVDQVFVKQGDLVTRGQILFTMNDETIQLTVLEDQASLTQAYATLGLRPGQKLGDRNNVPAVKKALSVLNNKKKNYEQYKELRRQELISDQQLDDQKQLYESAKSDYDASLEQVDQNLAAIQVQQAKLEKDRYQEVFTRVPSPIDGAVQQVNVTPGGSASTGSSSVSIIDMNDLYLSLAVPQELVPKVARGRIITGQVTTVPPVKLTATVEQVDPALNTDTRTLTVRARILNPDSFLRPGMFAEISFDTGDSLDSLLVPQSAVLTQAGLSYVYLLEQQSGKWIAHQSSVRLGDTEGDWVEVTGTLKIGDKVASSNLAALRDKQQVDLGQVTPPYGTGP